MSYRLKDNLPIRIKKLNVTIAEFERMAGLNRNAIQNILKGRSKNPTADTLQKIANALQCGVDELLNEKVTPMYTRKHISMSKTKDETLSKIEQHELMNQIVSYALTQLKTRQITPSTVDFFNAIKEIYDYCVEGQNIAFDKRFTDWTLSNYFYKSPQIDN